MFGISIVSCDLVQVFMYVKNGSFSHSHHENSREWLFSGKAEALKQDLIFQFIDCVKRWNTPEEN